MKWPVKLPKPMFEARAAFAVPNNYYQNLLVDGQRLGNGFAHGATRSIFFSGSKLVLFSKSVNQKDGKQFFTSFVLLHLESSEYTTEVKGDNIALTASIDKNMRNLISGKMERKKISFAFKNMQLTNRIVSKERVLASAQFKAVYSTFGGASTKSASMDMEGYAITVPHFSPHPFLLQLKQEFGFESNRQFQEHVVDYFREHL
jgi:hypothetical protein